ncbi:MAG: hypothetical protein Q4G30_05120 [Actinomycetaceae bacterium]|nr:hypothetical protein [Actinomycetaceae bacterium]
MSTPKPRSAAAALRRALRWMSLAVAAVLFASALVSWLVYGTRGMPSVGVAAAVCVLLIAVTAWSHHMSLMHPDLTMAFVGGDFLIKLVTVLASVIITKKIEGVFEPSILFFTLVAAILAMTIAQTTGLAVSRVSIIDADENPADLPENQAQ